jgi:hypothetical protein
MFVDACPQKLESGYGVEGGATGTRIPAWVVPRSALDAPFDGRYSKRVPIAVEQPVLYTSPFRR